MPSQDETHAAEPGSSGSRRLSRRSLLQGAATADAILLTGIPAGVINKTFTNYTGSVLADMLRLNTTIPPTAKPAMLGLLGGDPAGFPNGRRPGDDVVTIELRALAGLTYKYVDPNYSVDQAASAISDFNSAPALGSPPTGTFPYLGTPYCGYNYAPAS